jgi:hypothetical protein
VRRFGDPERWTLREALAEAEARIGAFYRIPGREWRRVPYDLETLAEGPGPAPGAFADVVRLCRQGASASGGDLWRIRIGDQAILDAVHRRADGIELRPLLLYVLTHELVHVVRFGTGLAGFEADLAERHAEEGRVHAVTRRVLQAAAGTALRRVMDAYRDAAWGAGGRSPK